MANIGNVDKDAIFAEEDFVVEAQTFLHALMEEKGISRSDLARAMGVSRARISQIFSDECKNFTIRLLARAFYALGETPVLGKKASEKGDQDGWSAIMLAPEDLQLVWNMSKDFSSIKALIPSNDQVPKRLIGYDYSHLEWEAA